MTHLFPTFDGLQLRFSAGEQTTPRQRLEKEIVTGCTISVVLFVMGMNLIINAAKRVTRGPKIHLPSNRGFKDALTISTTTRVQAGWLLTALDDMVNWVSMKFKPNKCRKFKAWLYQHGLYQLDVPPSFTSIGLYGRTNQLKLPLTSIIEEFKVAKGRLAVTLKESTDDLIRKVGIQTRTGRKWSASQAVDRAESRLQHKDIVETSAVGRQGLGNTKPQRWITSSNKERSQMVQQETRLTEQEDRQAIAIGIEGQCAWTRWKTTERHLTWADIWHYEPLRSSC